MTIDDRGYIKVKIGTSGRKDRLKLPVADHARPSTRAFSSHTATSIFSFSTQHAVSQSQTPLFCSASFITNHHAVLMSPFDSVRPDPDFSWKVSTLCHLEFAPGACELLCNRYLFTPYSSSYLHTEIPLQPKSGVYFPPQIAFRQTSGVSVNRFVSYPPYQDIKMRTALPISNLPPFSMNRVPCSIYSYPLPTVPEFLLQCCTPTRRSHQRSAFQRCTFVTNPRAE